MFTAIVIPGYLHTIFIIYFSNVVEYWRTITIDNELSGIVLDNFLTILSSSCLYEQTGLSQHDTVAYKDDKLPQIATIHPFSIVCAMHEMFLCVEIKSVSEVV